MAKLEVRLFASYGCWRINSWHLLRRYLSGNKVGNASRNQRYGHWTAAARYGSCSGNLLKERVTMRQWSGLVIGLLGLYLVLFERMDLTSDFSFESFSIWAVIAVVTSLFAISFGTVYQKRFCNDMDLISGAWIQYFSALILCILVAMFFETGDVAWTRVFIYTLTWQVLALSIGAIFLLMIMIKHSAPATLEVIFIWLRLWLQFRPGFCLKKV